MLKERNFGCIGEGGVLPNELLNVGPGDAPKDALFGLGRGVHRFFCVLCGCNCVKNYGGLIKERNFGCGVVLTPMSC